jgi:shikimate kinase
MGSGKTAAGRRVALRLGLPFIDLDEQVELREGRTVDEIFTAVGETGFRRAENETLADLLNQHGDGALVLSLGGGTVTWPESAALLESAAFVVLIKTSPETLWGRICDDTGRPLAQTRDGFLALAALRSDIYEATADAIVDADGLDEDEVVDRIVALFGAGLHEASPGYPSPGAIHRGGEERRAGWTRK